MINFRFQIEDRLLNQAAVPFKFLKNIHCFPEAALFHIPSSSIWGFQFLHDLDNTCDFLSLWSQPCQWVWHILVVSFVPQRHPGARGCPAYLLSAFENELHAMSWMLCAGSAMLTQSLCVARLSPQDSGSHIWRWGFCGGRDGSWQLLFQWIHKPMRS